MKLSSVPEQLLYRLILLKYTLINISMRHIYKYVNVLTIIFQLFYKKNLIKELSNTFILL